jgi:hypothetical protein
MIRLSLASTYLDSLNSEHRGAVEHGIGAAGALLARSWL